MSDKIKSLLIFFVFLLMTSLIVLLYFGYNLYSQTKSENEALYNNLTEANADINKLSGMLVSKNDQIEKLATELGMSVDMITQLQDVNLDLSEQNNDLQDELTQLNQEVQTTADTIVQYEQQIRDSMAWFRVNDNIDSYSDYDQIKKSIQADCVKIDNRTCNIKLSCLPYVLNEKFDFGYRTDDQTSSQEDFLQNLSAIYDHKGGDCEDYSQLAFAQINSLRSYCESNNAPNLIFQTFVDQTDAKHHVEYSEQYYIENAKDYDLPSGYSYVYPTCGSLPAQFDPQNLTPADKSFGHCLLAFSDRTIQNASDIYYFLSKAILVEPQNGRLVTSIQDQSQIVIPSDDYPASDSYINIVISDQDLYHFNAFDNQYRWFGYLDIQNQIERLQTSLDELF